jgi:preprotein translocase subunit SecE
MAKENKTNDTAKKSKNAAKGGSGQTKKPNIFARLMDYFRGVRTELKRVTWPTRKEVLNSCVIVIVTLVFFAALTTLIDSGATEVITLWNKIGKPSVESTATPTPETTTTPTPETTGTPVPTPEGEATSVEVSAPAATGAETGQ